MHSTEQIKQFILENLTRHQKDIIKASIHKFGISRQAILKHMHTLISEDRVVAHGKTRDRFYELKPRVNYSKSIEISNEFSHIDMLQNQILPNLKILSKNVYDICEFSIMAILSNTIDHAKASRIYYKLFVTDNDVHIILSDNGRGIFDHIKQSLDLDDLHVAAIEIAKGHVTSDPENHAGDELRTVVHLFDKVTIDASGLCLSYFNPNKDWTSNVSSHQKGTRIHLEIKTNSTRKLEKVFHRLFDKERRFIRIPVSLVRTAGEQVSSRQQAQCLLNNISDLQSIEFDFNHIDLIGPAFADELVRKTKHKNNSININWINSNKVVDVLMSRAVNRLT